MGLNGKSKKYFNKYDALALSLVFLMGLFIFKPTFSLGIFGDTWMVFWNGIVNFGGVWSWSSWTTYFGPYGAIHLLVYMLGKTLGFNGVVFYISAFLLRFAASTGIYIFLRNRNISRSISTVASVIFMLTPIGLETTDWVFQMNSYISLLFLILGIDITFRLNSVKNLILFFILFVLSIIINPIRAHGMVATFWLLLTVELIIAKKQNRKIVAVALGGSVLAIYLLALKLTFGDLSSNFLMMEEGKNLIAQSLSVFNPQVFMNYFSSISNVLIPENLIKLYVNLNFTKTFFGRFMPTANTITIPLVVSTILLFWKKYLMKSNKIKIILLVSVFLPSLLLVVVNKLIFPLFSLPNAITTSIAIVFLVNLIAFSIFDYVLGHFDQLRVDVLLISTTFFFAFIPWIHDPGAILSSYHRYLVYSSLTTPILVAVLLSAGTDIVRGKKVLVFIKYAITFSVFLTFIFLTRSYVSNMLQRHSNDYVSAVWNNLDTYLKGVNFTNRRTLFYFTGENSQRTYDSVYYVFGHHAGVRYGIQKLDDIPIVTNNFLDLKSMVTDGKASIRYIGKEYKYNINDVYLFKIVGTDVEKLDIKDICKDCV